jgi:salicylate hydroxylase
MLTFPVNHGKTLNIVAFRYGEEDWTDHERLTKLGKRTQALKDFEGWSSNVLKLLSMCDEELNIVSLRR